MKKLFSKEVKIGIVGLMALFALIFGVKYLKGISLFQSSSYYMVTFKDVNGLPKSSPVYADGLKVGIVSDLIYDYEHPGNVVVEIDVNPNLRIPAGSQAELSTDLLGAVKMTLLLANNPRERVSVGDTIPGSVNSGAMGEAAKMVPDIQKMMPKLDSILTSLNALLADPAIAMTLHNIEGLTASLNNNSRHIEHLMKNELPELTAKMNRIGDNFETLSGNLKQIDFASTMEKVDATLANVQSLTSKLEQDNNTVGLMLNDPSLYNNLNQTAANAASLLNDLQSHPKRYVHFSIFGKKDK